MPKDNPKGSKHRLFNIQRPDEQLVLMRRRHPWSLVKPGLISALIAIIIIVMLALFGPSWPFAWSVFIGLPIGLYIGATAYFTWYNSVTLLTTDRLITLDQKSWFSRDLSETPLNRIVSVTHSINGPIASILNFGKISIRSSGASTDEIALTTIANPMAIQQTIITQMKQALELSNNSPRG